MSELDLARLKKKLSPMLLLNVLTSRMPKSFLKNISLIVGKNSRSKISNGDLPTIYAHSMVAQGHMGNLVEKLRALHADISSHSIPRLILTKRMELLLQISSLTLEEIQEMSAFIGQKMDGK